MKYEIYEMKGYLCDWCDKYLGNLEGQPYVEDGDDNYCPDCALKLGKINAMEWLDMVQYPYLERIKSATYKDGSIIYFEQSGKGYVKRELQIFDRRGNRISGEGSI